MNNTILSIQKSGYFFSVSIFLLLPFLFIPLQKEENSGITPTEEVTWVNGPEEDFTHCDPIFTSVNNFCAPNYSISGLLPSHCSFNWIGSSRCSGITANVSYYGNWVTISGTGSPGDFCKFRYSLSDTHGNTYNYLLGVRFYEEGHWECCTEGPCI